MASIRPREQHPFLSNTLVQVPSSPEAAGNVSHFSSDLVFRKRS